MDTTTTSEPTACGNRWKYGRDTCARERGHIGLHQTTEKTEAHTYRWFDSEGVPVNEDAEQADTFKTSERVVCGDGGERVVTGMTHRKGEPARVVVEGGAEWIAADCSPAETECDEPGDAGTGHGAYEYWSGH